MLIAVMVRGPLFVIAMAWGVADVLSLHSGSAHTLAPPTRQEDLMRATKPSDLEIVLTRTFRAPREDVFAAITQAERVFAWMKPSHMTLAGCEIDLRVGGRLRYVFARPNGRKIEVRGTFESVDAPRSFAYRESYDFSPLVVQVTTALDARGKATAFRQTLRYASKKERDEDYPGVASSSKEVYAKLEEYLARRPEGGK
jgi:uncharacterized protein YndB with AHSA1/START domain